MAVKPSGFGWALAFEATRPCVRCKMNDIVDTPPLRRRMKRKDACAFLSERLGAGVSSPTIRRWPIPYVQIGRDASYAQDDLERFVEQRLESAPHRMPLP